jgi:hypothetical protein
MADSSDVSAVFGRFREIFTDGAARGQVSAKAAARGPHEHAPQRVVLRVAQPGGIRRVEDAARYSSRAHEKMRRTSC